MSFEWAVGLLYLRCRERTWNGPETEVERTYLGRHLGGLGGFVSFAKLLILSSNCKLLCDLLLFGNMLTKMNPCNILKDNTIIIQRGKYAGKNQKGKR